jgi:[acyl-carrier-protein] S-malonyltransferase
MQEAVPAGEGAMSAVIGLEGQAVSDACREVEALVGETCSAANFNSPEQTVIAGTVAAIAKAAEVLKARGARKVLPLPVSAPFHCALMKPAEERLSPYLEAVNLGALSFPVVTNVDVLSNEDPEVARDALRRQVCAPVRWVETVQALSLAAAQAVEVGPGAVLAGLGKRIAKDWPVRSTGTVAGIEKLLAELSTAAAGD